MNDSFILPNRGSERWEPGPPLNQCTAGGKLNGRGSCYLVRYAGVGRGLWVGNQGELGDRCGQMIRGEGGGYRKGPPAGWTPILGPIPHAKNIKEIK